MFDKTFWPSGFQKGLDKVSRRQCGIHKRSGKTFVKSGGQMDDNRNVLRCLPAVVARKQVSSDGFNRLGLRHTAPATFLSLSSLLEGRTKQRRLKKPYWRSVSTTFVPIKPFEPVIKIRSPGEQINSGFTVTIETGDSPQTCPVAQFGLRLSRRFAVIWREETASYGTEWY